MQTTPGMVTWQIFSDAANNFRWEVSGKESATGPEEPDERTLIHRDNLDFRIPSMADLLFQGSSKLLENNGRNDSSPMFRTGSGKSVAMKQSSIMKALSVLGEEDMTMDRSKVSAIDGGYSFSNSLFQTGSGKSVNISSAGLIRAKMLLGLEENYKHCTTQDLEHAKNQSIADELCCRENPPHMDKSMDMLSDATVDARYVPRSLVNCQTDMYSSGRETIPNLLQESACKPPQIKFQTAGGRSISVSSDALQRARSLLGDSDLGSLPNKDGSDDLLFSMVKDKRIDETSLNKENDPYVSCLHQNAAASKCTSKSSLPTTVSFSDQKQPSSKLEAVDLGSKFLKQIPTNSFVSEGIFRLNSDISCLQKASSNKLCPPYMIVENSLGKNIGPRATPKGRLAGGPHVDISNNVGTANAYLKTVSGKKRRLGRRSSVSPFKKPRSSRFSAPLNNITSFISKASTSVKTSEESCCKTKVSARYPFQIERMTVREYFGQPPCCHNLLGHVSADVKCMTADSAEKYMFHDTSGFGGIGAEAFCHMLAQSGASLINASKEWVANHYKWIVWKLACYERSYPAKAAGKFLTLSNVLEELKYRYEREVNHGHRSPLKRILEGDASAASMVVLCIATIRFYPDKKLDIECPMTPNEDTVKLSSSNLAKDSNIGKIELTDGWYSVDAHLDVLLSKQLVAGKLFVGQKLRLWGASLRGWLAPVSPLEASKTVSLQLHINGTYRANWADRLGFCKGLGAPLAFGCIKSAGGLVPKTLVGIKRIYPVLYKERLTDGGSVVRSERMETKMLQLYNQRRSVIAEGVIFELQKDAFGSHGNNDNDSEEGAKIFKILERAAEPEVIMAEMSSEQLSCFSTYQAKREAIRQSDMQKKIEKALENAGLSARQVTPFMRVRIVGLTSKHSQKKGFHKEGLITIWNPTEKQFELVEGQAYAISGLVALSSDSNNIHLHARGSTTTWQPLPPLAIESFEPFFTPRRSVLLSSLGEVSLASEFDVTAVVVYVGKVYISGRQKKQWVFVTDGSTSGFDLQSEGCSNCLLAISFCSPVVDIDAFSPISHMLAGSVAGFCNLVKQARDQMNHLWVAEATENSTYSICYDLSGCSHLKDAAGCVRKWAKTSLSTIQKLRERVLCIIGDHES